MTKKTSTNKVRHLSVNMSKYARHYTDENQNIDILKELEDQLMNGDRTAILKGVTFCALGKRDFPDWLLKEVINLNSIAECQKVKSLDDFLGYKRPPGKNLDSFEHNQSLQDELYSIVINAHNLNDAPLTRKTPKKSAFSYAVEHFECNGRKISESRVETIFFKEHKRHSSKKLTLK